MDRAKALCGLMVGQALSVRRDLSWRTFHSSDFPTGCVRVCPCGKRARRSGLPAMSCVLATTAVDAALAAFFAAAIAIATATLAITTAAITTPTIAMRGCVLLAVLWTVEAKWEHACASCSICGGLTTVLCVGSVELA